MISKEFHCGRLESSITDLKIVKELDCRHHECDYKPYDYQRMTSLSLRVQIKYQDPKIIKDFLQDSVSSAPEYA